MPAHDTIDNDGRITVRFAGKLLHLIGRAHARTEIICLIHNLNTTVLNHHGLVIAEFTLNQPTTTNAKTAEPPSPGVQPFTLS